MNEYFADSSGEYSPEKQSSIKTLSFQDVKNRLALLVIQEEARRFDVEISSISNVIAGRRPWSPLVPKIARRIKVPTTLLRTYLIELAAERNGNA